MKDLCIDYTPKNWKLKYFSLALAVYAAILAVYLCIKEVVAGRYEFWFFCILVLLALAILIILLTLINKPKPLVILTSESVYFNLGKDKKQISYWSDIQTIGIGISTLKIMLSETKSINVDLGTLRYNDIKDVKTRIIELCESKNIPFANL